MTCSPGGAPGARRTCKACGAGAQPPRGVLCWPLTRDSVAAVPAPSASQRQLNPRSTHKPRHSPRPAPAPPRRRLRLPLPWPAALRSCGSAAPAAPALPPEGRAAACAAWPRPHCTARSRRRGGVSSWPLCTTASASTQQVINDAHMMPTAQLSSAAVPTTSTKPSVPGLPSPGSHHPSLSSPTHVRSTSSRTSGGKVARREAKSISAGPPAAAAAPAPAAAAAARRCTREQGQAVGSRPAAQGLKQVFCCTCFVHRVFCCQ